MTEDSRRGCAEYLSSICRELAAMAEQQNFTLGATLLKMASIEFLERQDSLIATRQES